MRDHEEDELAHYAASCADVEFLYPFGWAELEGISNRTDFDLRVHQEATGRDLTFFDDATRDRYHPYVIEPAAGADRATLAFLVESYQEEEERVVLRLHPALAPIKLAIFPLVKKEGMPERAHEIEERLRGDFRTFYDEGGAIGRRYRRMDEAGTPFCVTVDGDTMSDGTVTLRERDSMDQVRLPIDEIEARLREAMRF